jgi:regulator of sigma E protease
MTIFEWFQLVAGNIWLYGGSFLLVLSLLVFIHEWGHYIIARKCGIRVDVFSIGFGKEIFGFTDKNQTRWKFSMIPLGGYVKLFGDVDPTSAGHTETVVDDKSEAPAAPRPMTPEECKVAFFSQSVGKRAAVVFAGPAINYLFAIIVLAGLYTFYGQPITPPVASAIVGDSAAEKVGFRPHDKVLKIDNVTINRFEDIRREVMVGLDEERTFTVERDGEVITMTTSPERIEEEDRFGFKNSRGMLGIIGPGNAVDVSHIVAINGKPYDDVEKVRAEVLSRMDAVFSIDVKRSEDSIDTMVILPRASQNEAMFDENSPDRNFLLISEAQTNVFIKHNIVESTALAINETITITLSTLSALGQMVTGTRSATELGGIIRIGAIAGDMAQSGVIALITFTALLSINLGLINLFPIPTLDGGHLVFYGLEVLKGQPISEQVQEYAFRVGFVMLVGLMLFANINDIMQLIL